MVLRKPVTRRRVLCGGASAGLELSLRWTVNWTQVPLSITSLINV